MKTGLINSGILFALSLLISSIVSGKKPNVILVMTDDQGYGDLGCHGNTILKTPHFDRLHAESIRFTDFHVSPFCTPTRAALMTGNHPGFTGAYRTSAGRSMMHPDEKTIAHLFAEAGYATGMAGKWHLGDNAPHRPQDRGFQDVVWHRCGGIGQASDHWGNDYFDDTYERVTPGSKKGTFESFKGYCTDIFFREGLRFVEKNKDKPFFLYLALNAPHGPYRVPPAWAAPYRNNPNVANPNFYGMIANIDHNMGLLRNRLDEMGLADNTILIFMTDNGTSAGAKFKDLDSEAVVGYNAGMRGKKSSVYDGGHRVPFFIHWSQGGLQGGRDIKTMAAHIDVLPTLADLCGIPVGENYKGDGLSLKPLLEGSQEPWPREHHVLQYHGGAFANAMPPGPLAYSVVLTERWRLVNSDGQALFDIEQDPAQRTNLATQHPKVVKQLRKNYDLFWKKVSPRLTPVRIDLGNSGEPITRLSSQDWHMKKGNPPWNFSSIKKLPKVTAPWLVNVKRPGRYRFTLRQWPAEANKLVFAERAKITIAGKEQEGAIDSGCQAVTIELNLPAGPAELMTFLTDQKGRTGGAYFTDVEWLGEHDLFPKAPAKPQSIPAAGLQPSSKRKSRKR
ncbi:arylsulfatase [Akkermansiaceae bacterium]|jgi:arylsulfatase A-like enzyme|nr:arylsulfatase [Akkermansiaceae bacterium]